VRVLSPKEASLLAFPVRSVELINEEQPPTGLNGCDKRSPRAAYTAIAQVCDIVDKSIIGYIADVSTNGFKLFSGLDLRTNQRCLVSVDLPHPEKGKTTIEIGIRVVWKKEDKDNRQLQAVGCEILAIDPLDQLNFLHSSMAYSKT